MRIATLLLATFTLSLSAWALPVLPLTFNDPLASQDPNDVIGDPAKFDIHYLRFTNTLQIDIRFNYGGGTGLGAFNIGGGFPTLNVGDLLLRTSTSTYAFVLGGHNGLNAGSLYRVTGTQTAAQVLGNPSGNYRPNAAVWGSGTGATLINAGSIQVNTVGGVSTQLLTTLNLVLNNTVINELNNGFSFSFASATCGNDLIEGNVAGIPEPGTWAMLGAGLIGLGLLRRKR
jgi:hypothetical protein